MANIKVALGGYMGEKLKFSTTSDGVVSDFKTAMSQAHTMVWRFGMGANGFLGDFSAIPKDELSEKVKEKLNNETQNIFHQCAKDVELLLTQENEVWEECAQQLLKRDELEYDDIVEIFTKHGHPAPVEPGKPKIVHKLKKPKSSS